MALSPLGVGAAGFGKKCGFGADLEAHEAVKTAWDAGVRFFDTAPFYGYGLSERRLGDALRSYPRDSYILSTKVGRLLQPRRIPIPSTDEFPGGLPFTPHFDYSFEGVMRSYQESLQRLGLERVDILLLHDLGAFCHGEGHPKFTKEALEGGCRALHQLKEEGAVSRIGIGVNEWEIGVELLPQWDFDVVLLAGRYTLLDQIALDALFPECERRGVEIILAAPFNSGILLQGSESEATYNYRPPSAEILAKTKAIEEVCQMYGVPMPAAALQFPLRHSMINRVVVGMPHAEYVRSNHLFLDVEIPEDFWQELGRRGIVEGSILMNMN